MKLNPRNQAEKFTVQSTKEKEAEKRGNLCVCAQSCLTLCNPMDCSPPGSSVHGIFQAGILERVAISYSRGSSQPRDRTQALLLSYLGSLRESQRSVKTPILESTEHTLGHYWSPSERITANSVWRSYKLWEYLSSKAILRKFLSCTGHWVRLRKVLPQ